MDLKNDGVLIDNVIISGWGSTRANVTHPYYPDHLQVALINTVDTAECKKYEFHGNYIDDKLLCVIDSWRGTCYGDR